MMNICNYLVRNDQTWHVAKSIKNKQMKRIKIVYWISTGVFSLIILAIASAYLFSGQLKASFSHLGFPDYFRDRVGCSKICRNNWIASPSGEKQGERVVICWFCNYTVFRFYSSLCCRRLLPDH